MHHYDSCYTIANIETGELAYSFDEFDENDNQVPWFPLFAPLSHHKYLMFGDEQHARDFIKMYSFDTTKVEVVKLTTTVKVEKA